MMNKILENISPVITVTVPRILRDKIYPREVSYLIVKLGCSSSEVEKKFCVLVTVLGDVVDQAYLPASSTNFHPPS